jgi:hypothetical protein
VLSGQDGLAADSFTEFLERYLESPIATANTIRRGGGCRLPPIREGLHGSAPDLLPPYHDAPYG